jgi:serine/threonine protein kinase
VALKVLNRDGGDVGDMGARLRDEARMLGIIRHRAVVQVESLVTLDDRWTIVMERIDGCDLGRLTSGMVPPGPALEILAEVASALHVAHATEHNGRPLGLLHRDLKPSNILLTRNGEVKVVDFGGARADFEGRRAKTVNVTLGSPGYMAPERFGGHDGPAGDVYALGVVLLELVTGQRFGPTTGRASAHRDKVDAALRSAGLQPELDALVRSLLAFEADERPSARELEGRARDLRGVVGGPWLRDWAEEHVVPAPLQELGHDFSATMLFERLGPSADAGATFDGSDDVVVNVLDTFMPDELDDALPPDPSAMAATRLSRLPPRAPRPAMTSWLVRLIGVIVVAAVASILAVGVGLVGVLFGLFILKLMQ